MIDMGASGDPTGAPLGPLGPLGAPLGPVGPMGAHSASRVPLASLWPPSINKFCYAPGETIRGDSTKTPLFTALGASERSKHRYLPHLAPLNAQNTAIDRTWRL